MSAANCTIQIEQLDERRFRATCTLLPDCEVTASTEEAAREAVEAALEEYLRERVAENKADAADPDA